MVGQIDVVSEHNSAEVAHRRTRARPSGAAADTQSAQDGACGPQGRPWLRRESFGAKRRWAGLGGSAGGRRRAAHQVVCVEVELEGCQGARLVSGIVEGGQIRVRQGLQTEPVGSRP